MSKRMSGKGDVHHKGTAPHKQISIRKYALGMTNLEHRQWKRITGIGVGTYLHNEANSINDRPLPKKIKTVGISQRSMRSEDHDFAKCRAVVNASSEKSD